MPRTVPIALNPNSRFDRFNIGILDSAGSHDRPLDTAVQLVLQVAGQAYAGAVAHARGQGPNQWTVVHGGLRLIFRAATANERQNLGWAFVLFHVDMTRADKATQMQKRFAESERRGPGGGAARQTVN